MNLTPEQLNRVAQWRAKALTSEGLDLEEMKAAIIFLRESRQSAVPQSNGTTKSKSPRSKAPVNTDALLGELGL